MSAALNGRKREEMAQLVGDAIARGWTAPALASYLRVSVGTIGTWKRGTSMGTNAQRAELRSLASPRAVLPEAIAAIRQAVEREESVLAEARAANAHESSIHSYRVRAAKYRERLDALESLLAAASL